MDEKLHKRVQILTIVIKKKKKELYLCIKDYIAQNSDFLNLL